MVTCAAVQLLLRQLLLMMMLLLMLRLRDRPRSRAQSERLGVSVLLLTSLANHPPAAEPTECRLRVHPGLLELCVELRSLLLSQVIERVRFRFEPVATTLADNSTRSVTDAALNEHLLSPCPRVFFCRVCLCNPAWAHGRLGCPLVCLPIGPPAGAV